MGRVASQCNEFVRVLPASYNCSDCTFPHASPGSSTPYASSRKARHCSEQDCISPLHIGKDADTHDGRRRYSEIGVMGIIWIPKIHLPRGIARQD